MQFAFQDLALLMQLPKKSLTGIVYGQQLMQVMLLVLMVVV